MAVFAAYAEAFPDGEDWVEELERICRMRRQ
jgi:hypothetical protein